MKNTKKKNPIIIIAIANFAIIIRTQLLEFQNLELFRAESLVNNPNPGLWDQDYCEAWRNVGFKDQDYLEAKIRVGFKDQDSFDKF